MSDSTLQRDDVAMKMLAAWMNARVDQMPPENNTHLNAFTMAAWQRVAEAAAAEERAKIVAWLRKENGRCDCFAYEDNECACGGRDEYKIWPLEQTANYLERGEHLK